MKKTFALAALAASFLLILVAPAAASGTQEGSDGAPRTLIISTWGLSEDVLWQDVYGPFEKAYDCKVVLETGTTAERYTKLSSNPNSTVDVIELSQKAAADGYAAKLFSKVDYGKIANAQQLIPGAKDMTKSGFGPAYTLNSIGIIYNPTALGFEIKEWADLWRPELANRISIPALSTTFGPAMVYVAADFAKVKVAKDKGAAAFKALESLKKNIVKTYTKSSDLANMFSSGEIVAPSWATSPSRSSPRPSPRPSSSSRRRAPTPTSTPSTCSHLEEQGPGLRLHQLADQPGPAVQDRHVAQRDAHQRRRGPDPRAGREQDLRSGGQARPRRRFRPREPADGRLDRHLEPGAQQLAAPPC